MEEEAKQNNDRSLLVPRQRGAPPNPRPARRQQPVLPENPLAPRQRAGDRRATTSLLQVPLSAAEMLTRSYFFVIEFVAPFNVRGLRSRTILVNTQFSPRVNRLAVIESNLAGFSGPNTTRFANEIALIESENDTIRERTLRMTDALYEAISVGNNALVPTLFRVNHVNGRVNPSVVLSDFLTGAYTQLDSFLVKSFQFSEINARHVTREFEFTLDFPLTSFKNIVRNDHLPMRNAISVLDRFMTTLFIDLITHIPSFRANGIRVSVDPILNIGPEGNGVGKRMFRVPASTYDHHSILPNIWDLPNGANQLTHHTPIVSSQIESFLRGFFQDYHEDINGRVSLDIENLFISIAVGGNDGTNRVVSQMETLLRTVRARKQSGVGLPEVVVPFVLGERRDTRAKQPDGQRVPQYDCMDIFLMALSYMLNNPGVRSIRSYDEIKLVSSTQVLRRDPLWKDYKDFKDRGFDEVLDFLETRYSVRIYRMRFIYNQEGYPEEIVVPEDNVGIYPLALIFIYYKGEEVKAHIEFSITVHLRDIVANVQRVRNIKPLALCLHEAAPSEAFSATQLRNTFWTCMRIPPGSKKKSTAFFRVEEKEKKKENEIIQFFWDIETYSADQRPPFLSVLREGTIIKIFKGPDCVKKTLDYLTDFVDGLLDRKNIPQVIVWSYNGSRFDHMYLLPHLNQAQIMGTKTLAKGICIPISRMIKGKKVERNLFFYDFCLTLGGGLERAYKEVVPGGELSKKVWDIDASRFDTEYIQEHEFQIENYCINDTAMLQDLVLTFFSQLNAQLPFEVPKVAMSASSLAWKVFSSNFLPAPKSTDDFRYVPHGLIRPVYNIVRESYFGGYTQCFCKEMKSGNYYDINSSYPDVMKKEVPLKFVEGEELERLSPGSTIRLHYLNWWRFPKGFPYPSIPVRTKNGNYYPRTGEGAWVWDHYLEFAKETLLEYEEDVSKRLHFTKGRIFSEYIDTFYEQKKKSSGGVKIFAKLMLNSLYGKCGEDEHDKIFLSKGLEMTEEIKAMLDDKKWLLKNVEFQNEDQVLTTLTPNKECDPTGVGSLVHIASWITSSARLSLYKVILDIHKRGGVVYYCDTDSIFTNIALDASMISPDELGKWKLEFVVKNGRFWGSKFYCVVDAEDKIHTHIKGLQSRLTTPELAQTLWGLPLQVDEWSEADLEKVWISPTFVRKWGVVIDKPFFKVIQQTTGIRRNFTGIYSEPWEFINANNGLGYAAPHSF